MLKNFAKKTQSFIEETVWENIDGDGAVLHVSTNLDNKDAGFPLFFFMTIVVDNSAILSFTLRDLSGDAEFDKMGQIFEAIPWYPACMNADGYAPPETPEKPNDWTQEPKWKQSERGFVELRTGSMLRLHDCKDLMEKMIVDALKSVALHFDASYWKE